MVLNIITFRDDNSEILFKRTRKVEFFDKNLAELANDMKETLLFNDGLGLAAPQVNQGLAMCLVRAGKEIRVLCNPEIICISEKQEQMEEGCLSFPNVFMDIYRAKDIEVNYQDLKGKSKKLKASGILARTLQHEIDHLNGTAFIERA